MREVQGEAELQSACRLLSPPVVLAKRSRYGCGASSGQCTFCKARYRKKGTGTRATACANSGTPHARQGVQPVARRSAARCPRSLEGAARAVRAAHCVVYDLHGAAREEVGGVGAVGGEAGLGAICQVVCATRRVGHVVLRTRPI